MSTKPRIVAPGVIYQVYSKGVQELQIFKKDEIKTFFLQQLQKSLKKYDFTCLAFSISLNQYHLVLQSDKQSISLAMQHFNSILAKTINKVLGRGGTVFSSRFISVIVEDNQLNKLIREVHLKSLQLGEMTLNELEHYKFCSHSVLMGNSTSDLLNREVILKKMGIDSKEKYYQLITDTGNSYDGFNSKMKDVNNAKQGFREPQLYVIGKPEFVKKVIALDNCRRLQIARYISENVKMETIHEKVARFLIMKNEDLYHIGQSNERSTGRELFVTICKKYYEFSGAELARHLRVTEAAVSRMLSRFRNVENREYLIQKVLEEIT
jgi:REP element-mobilizing transposase RayT